jgi:hypothetical protein
MPQNPEDKKEDVKKKPKKDPKNGVDYDEKDLDEAVEETFPASDPIAPQDPGRSPSKGKRG